MALEDLSVAEVISRSYARALPANKVVSLVARCADISNLTIEQRNTQIADTLVQILLTPHPPFLLFAYLQQLVNADISLGNSFTCYLLASLSQQSTNTSSPSTDILVPICNSLLSTAWATAPLPLPGTFELPTPDIGSSTTPAPTPSTTLSLAMPLIRLCCASTTPMPIGALTIRIISAIPPYPAPPLEVGIEASSLIASLPEIIAQPLRAALSGLMADLTMSTGAAALSFNDQGQGQAQQGQYISDSNQTHGQGQRSGEKDETEADIPTLPSPFSGPAPIPISHAISFLLAYAQREARSAQQVEGGLWSTHLDILRVGRALRFDSGTFALHLIEGAIVGVLDRYQALDKEFEEALVFMTEHLPDMLKWWKGNSTDGWPYPSNVAECIKTALETSRSGLDEAWAQLQREYQARVSHAEQEDEGGSFAPVSEAAIASYAETFLRKLVQVGVISAEEARAAMPGAVVESTSLFGPVLDDLLESHRASIPVKELQILTGPASQRPFAASVLSFIRSTPQSPLPENLLSILSSSPALLASLTTIIPPKALLAVSVDRLLEAPIDESARNDDPQGVLTRFGEGVVLVEAVVQAFELEMPEMLKQARRATAVVHLEEGHRGSLSGWIKALFGSEGIDDQIILTTAPQDMCWIATTVIQQAIFALSAGQLDLDALHSGLSYFAQPLLSWCLGGIVSWLCSEIVRNGAIAALHLDVLQSLVLGDSFPEALLRVNAKAIFALLEPSAGLQEVIQKAEFDVQGVKAKLELIKAMPSSVSTAANAIHPLNVLRSALQVIRHLEVTPPTWAPSFLADLCDTIQRSPPGSLTGIMGADILHPSMEYDQSQGDPLFVYTTIMLCLPLNGRQPHLSTAIDAALQGLLSLTRSMDEIITLAGVIQGAVMIYEEVRPGEAGEVLKGIIEKMEELEGQAEEEEKRRASKRRRKDGNGDGERNRSRSGGAVITGGELDLGTKQLARSARMVRRILGADEELKGRVGSAI